MRQFVLGVAAVTSAALVLAPGTATAAPGQGGALGHTKSDTRHVGADYNNGKRVPLAKTSDTPVAPPVKGPSSLGTTKTWLNLDDFNGRYRLETFTLRGIGDHIEIWVSNTLTFPAGDCRNTVGSGALVTVTDAQVQSFIPEFDTNIYPKESAAFSVAPRRNGSKAVLDDLLSDPTSSQKKGESKLPSDYWVGDGDNTVVLVDNVRDANYYHPTSLDGQTYIAGFFSSQLNDYFDRNVMTIDAFDWLHRTGATPPDDHLAADYAACSTALGVSPGRELGLPRPHLYEGTFAHEYQHLLEHYVDPDEVSWVNEGLSDWAQTLVGYVNTNVLPTDPKADSHIACFQGFLGQSFGGPENSLTRWGDQGDPEILCDYGAAYSFMEYLHGRFGGDAFMSALHREPGNGLVGLQNVLDQFAPGAKALQVLHDWLAMMALDNAIDSGAAGADPARYTAPTLKSMINWDSPQAYDTPGAPTNGADFVKLPAGLSSLSFSGAASYDPDPMRWTSVTDAPSHGTDAALYSGNGDEIDNAAVTGPITVNAGDSLGFDTLYNTEESWDFFFVQASTDNGATWTSLPIAGTTSTYDPSAYPTIGPNVPGFTGYSGGWVHKTYDLSAYAGKSVRLSFRYVTDWGTTGATATVPAGVWVDNVAVGSQAISDGTAVSGFQSMTQVHPVPVAGWTVQVAAYGPSGSWTGALDLTPNGNGLEGTLSAAQLAAVQATGATVVGALVTADDPTESSTKYAKYTLTANGAAMPGGGEA